MIKNIYLWKFTISQLTDSQIFPISYNDKPPKNLLVVCKILNVVSEYELIEGILFKGCNIYVQTGMKQNPP